MRRKDRRERSKKTESVFLREFVGGGIRKNDIGAEINRLFFVHHAVCHDDDNVTGLHLARCRSVETNLTTAAFTSDDVCLKSFAVVVVNNVNMFVREDVGGIHQVTVNGDAANIVEIGIRNSDTMNF